jgi:peroxiredoxin
MIRVGDIIPNLTLRSISLEGIKTFNFYENFKSKKILIICLPGAFTSTCHFNHLPPFINGADKLMKIKKINQIYCMTTNDPEILDIWRKDLGDSSLIFLSDGNSEFCQSTKLFKEFKNSFMGTRLKRSVLFLDDLKIRNIFIDESGLKNTSYENIMDKIQS